MSDKNPEQRINMKFGVKIGKCSTETLALLTVAYGEYATNKSSDFNTLRTGAFKLFKCTFPGSIKFKSTFILCFFKNL